jgi:hypothetical protein
MSKHVLFYSKACRHCQAFLEELSRTPFVPEFRLVCVDKSADRPPLPSWLQYVPSLVVAGESKPLVGPGPVNNWLFERKMGGGQKTATNAIEDRNTPVTPPVYSPDMAPRPSATARGGGNSSSNGSMPSSGPLAAGSDGPDAYHGSEMGSTKWSDNYSFIAAAEFTSDKGYNPIGRNFESLLAVGSGGKAAGSSSSAGQQTKRSAKEDALARDFEAYTASRDRDVPGPTRRQ